MRMAGCLKCEVDKCAKRAMDDASVVMAAFIPAIHALLRPPQRRGARVIGERKRRRPSDGCARA